MSQNDFVQEARYGLIAEVSEALFGSTWTLDILLQSRKPVAAALVLKKMNEV